MSYQFFLQAHLNQDSQEISTEAILAIFENYIITKDDTYIDLQFDEENTCTIYMNTSNPTTSHFMIDRPCMSNLLGECIYKTMLLGNFVFLEPDGKQIIVVDYNTETHLPIGVIENLGKPAVAENLDDFLELYINNR